MLDPVRGGYQEYWKFNVSEPLITMPCFFEARFGTSYTRFRQLMLCFKLVWKPGLKRGGDQVMYHPCTSLASLWRISILFYTG